MGYRVICDIGTISCEWYQKVPVAAVRGKRNAYWKDFPGSTETKMLSAWPSGETASPWKWRLVGSSRWLTSLIRTMSPGVTISVGAVNESP